MDTVCFGRCTIVAHFDTGHKLVMSDVSDLTMKSEAACLDGVSKSVSGKISCDARSSVKWVEGEPNKETLTKMLESVNGEEKIMNYDEYLKEQMRRFNDYQAAARKTAVYPKESLVYPVLGLVDESEELFAELTRMVPAPGKILEEAGDVCWYIAELCSSLQLGLGMCWAYTVDRKLYNCPLNILPLRLSAQLAGRYKKALRLGNVAPDVAVVTAFAAELLFIVDCIVKEAGFSGIFQAMDRNIEKLAARAEAGTLKERGNRPPNPPYTDPKHGQQRG